MGKFKAFCERKKVDLTWRAYFVDALGAMALGLFASLLIGTIFQNEHSGEKLRRTIEEFEQFEGVDVCGIATDYCVYETVKDLIAFYPAKQVRVVTNCLAAVDDNDTKLADLMKENGIQGIEF